MDRRVPLLLNGGEQKADAALREALSAHELALDRKVRLASVLEVDGSGISSEDFGYALRAELDFVVSKGPNRSPEFAVEFDGSRHLSDPTTISRDRKKDRICKQLGLPLLRIGVEALNRRRKRTILAWLIDVFYLAERFHEMQDEGAIAPDEPFMYFSIFDMTPDGRLGPSLALDQEARLAMHEMARRGEAPRRVPEQITMDAYRADTRLELIESFALFELNQKRFIAGRAGVRNFGHFGGISASELAKDLALADAGERLARYRQGRCQPFGLEDLGRLRGQTEGWRREGNPCSNLSFPAFQVGG